MEYLQCKLCTVLLLFGVLCTYCS